MAARYCLVFHEVRTPDELVACFRLRHDVYSEYGYLPANVDGMEIDAWDVASHFLAGYDMDGGAASLVASGRVIVEERETPMARVVRGLLNGARSPALRRVGERAAFLPSERVFDLRPILYDGNGRRQTAVEFSRLARALHRRNMGWGHAIPVAAVGLARTLGAVRGIASCGPNRVSLYAETAGARVVEEAGVARYPDIERASVALLIPIDQLPEGVDRNTRAAAAALASGAWCACGQPCEALARFTGEGVAVARPAA
ncbi:MAG TPA: hypothetical protein VGO93_29780 [Candidatus Xenobia bacterium]|jgi:hypothetical protein